MGPINDPRNTVRNWQHDEQPRLATRRFGQTIPPSLLLRADQVIE
jgi:hypothetical protein